MNQISWIVVISDGDEDDADEVSWAVRSHGARRCRVVLSRADKRAAAAASRACESGDRPELGRARAQQLMHSSRHDLARLRKPTDYPTDFWIGGTRIRSLRKPTHLPIWAGE
jgi:hypothetical protein